MDFSALKSTTVVNAPKSKKQQKKDKINMWVLSVALVALSTLVIVYFLPRSNTFSYDYRIGQPWRYGALFATQKFNIEMSDSARQAQQDSVRRVFQPYFNVNSTILPAMRAKLQAMEITKDNEAGGKIRAMRDSEMNTYVAHVLQLLDTVYSRGIIQPSVYDSLAANGVHAIRLIENKIARPVPLSRVFSTRSAYRFIMEYDREHYRPALLSKLNLNTVLEENANYDADKSQEEAEMLIGTLSTGVGFVMANEKIVDRGEIVTDEIYLKLKSYEKIMREQKAVNDRLPFIILGQTLMVLIIMTTLISYLRLFRHDYLDNPRCAIMLFALVAVFSIFGSTMVSHHFFHIFALPCCMVPIIIRVFLDSRTAYIFHTAVVVIISLVLSYPYEFIILQTVAGMIAIQNLRELQQRSQIIRTAVIITATYIVFYSAYELTLGVRLNEIDRTMLIYFTISGILLLFTYPLLWVFEKSFGFISDVTLVELSNINNPLLQQMTEVAPGTFQHSMQVANLASEVAKRIGAKAQLVRTAALYHDIGKMERPVFFTENQSGANPHKHLTPQKSAEVIIRHVTRGLELAKEHNLPEIIRRFIATHHGTGKVKYFYITYKNEHPDEPIDETLFTYPGPNPATTEEAILMMCDAVEAASRSLPEYTEENISALVDRLIDSMVTDGYFTECNITFRDIADTKSVLKERLRNVYHTRISYPELIKASDKQA